MRTVYKYELKGFCPEIEMPKGATPLHIGKDPQGEFCIWAEVDTEAETETRQFAMYGTGHQIPDGQTYLATVFDGDYVWHWYEAGND